MTISVTHPVVAGRKITPGDYDDPHTVTISAAGLLGSTAAGAVGRIPLGSGLAFSGGNLIATGGGGGSGAASGVTVSDYLDPARTPFVTDDLPAFNACRDAILAATEVVGFLGNRKMFIPAGRYYLSDVFDTKGLHVVGEHSAQPFGLSTLIRVAPNKGGIRLTASTKESASILEDVQIWGGNVAVNGSGVVTSYSAGTSTSGHGVEIGCNWGTCINVASYFFGGSGFNISGNSPLLANCFYLRNCQAMFNRGHGYEISGADANGGTTINCSSVQNGGSGFIDYSFLGNTHIQVHVRDCGMTDPTGTSGPVGSCRYDGLNYAVGVGQEVAASTTTPGTDSAVWTPWTGYGNPTAKTWTSGLTWIFARPICTNVGNLGNGRGKFINPYLEGAQAPFIGGAGWEFAGGVVEECNEDPNSLSTWTSAGYRTFIASAFKTRLQSGHYSFLGGQWGVAPVSTGIGWHNGTTQSLITTSNEWLVGGNSAFTVTTDGINLGNAKVLKVNGTQVVSLRGATVADATGGATIDTEARAAINALLARCRAHGLIGT